MTKLEFLAGLDQKLSVLNDQDLTRSIEYYSEIIDDRMEDGMTEEEAVASLGNADDIAAQIISEIPLKQLIKEKFKKRRKRNVWEILLASFGFLIIGLPVLVSLFSVAIGIYASLWAIVISLFSVPIALVGGSVWGIINCVYLFFAPNIAGAFFFLGASLVALGLVVPFYYAAKYFAIFTILITKGIILLIKKAFIK